MKMDFCHVQCLTSQPLQEGLQHSPLRGSVANNDVV